MTKDSRGIGDNSTQDAMPIADTSTGLIAQHEGRYDDMLQQAVRFLGKLCKLVRIANDQTHQSINGKNNVVRGICLRDVSATLAKLCKETKDWHAVIETMEHGKDVHIQENCKHNKLEIVAGSEYEFGQYIINQSSPKWCEKNTEGKDYIEKVTEADTDPQLDFDEGDDDSN